MNIRIMKIISILLDSNKYITVSSIAKTLNVSNKTIRNDLNGMGRLLSDNNLKLIRKPGVGIRIEGTEKAKLKMISNIKSYKQVSTQYTSFDRQLYILSELLTSDKNITTSTLQNELFISRPSVYNDLEKVKQWLLERDICLICDNKKRITIEAGEKRIRKAIFDLFFLSKEYDKTVDMIGIINNFNNANYASVNYFSYSQKEDVLGVDYKKVNKIVLKLQRKLNIKFTLNDLIRLTIKYCIAISRMMKGKYVVMKESTLYELKKLSEFDKMFEIAEEIGKEFDITVSTEEVGYLFGITIVSRTHFDDGNWNINEKMLAINRIIAQEIILLTKQRYYISDEKDFYNGIFHHLKSVTNKIKYGLDFENDFVEDIRKNYPDEFEIAFKSRSIFEEYYNYEIPIEEVGYIALHIAAAIERSKKPISAYIVYSSSYSEIKLMVEIIKNNFSQVSIKKVIPMSMINDVNFEDTDLIITTQKLDEELDSKTVLLPTALVYEDIHNLGKIVKQIYEKQNNAKLKKYRNMR